MDDLMHHYSKSYLYYNRRCFVQRHSLSLLARTRQDAISPAPRPVWVRWVRSGSGSYVCCGCYCWRPCECPRVQMSSVTGVRLSRRPRLLAPRSGHWAATRSSGVSSRGTKPGASTTSYTRLWVCTTPQSSSLVLTFSPSWPTSSAWRECTGGI